ncbi:hypothetical protein B0H13DRAFT_2240067 [Mycena leptocephala]|nr:hypothetical protein B0H13DRAFT_2240067 [Mycena leptocephala]
MSDGKVPCCHCEAPFKPRGLKTHETSCRFKNASKEKDKQFTVQLKVQQRKTLFKTAAMPNLFNCTGQAAYDDLEARLNDYWSPHDDSFHNEPGSPVNDDPNQRVPSPVEAEEPEIKRVFHPHSQHPPQFQSFQSFVRRPERAEPTDSRPWRPFRSQLDFEVAEFCETNMLKKDSTQTLISLIQRCNANPEDFTLDSQRELDELWELASHKCTEFVRGTVTIQYKDEDKTYNTYVRPLWDWARSLIQDPRLASSFIWDAEKAYKFDGETYVRFYQEPWTADAFWEAQSSLPDHPAAKPVCYVIYADKSKLSSFGTQKAYAVVARLANINIETRNSTRFGGGQVVGHQPIVDEDSKEKGKPAFANFKNIVWHTAFYELLESLVIPAKVGDWMTCGDRIPRWLWPIILILAADYEEACVMALIRGLTSMYPYLSIEHPQRVAEDSERLIQEARALRTAAEREELLKDNGLRDIENAFWKIRGADPHKALSFDPLHADDGGFWGSHLFSEIKKRATELGREAIVKIDEQFAAFPRWKGLNHFDSVMNTTFNDGSKHEDVAKMMLFAAHNVLVDEPGLLLLQALRSYLELRTAIKFEVHTSDTLAVGRDEILTLDSTMKTELYGNKDWNVPKFHSRWHALDHIEQKGASRNFGTKMSESMHGAIRKTYLRLTNFKDLVKHDHRRTVATYIREQIEALNEDPSESPEDTESTVLSNIDIGSKVKPVAFVKLEQDMSHDTAFHRFRVKFGVFITQFLMAHDYNLSNPNGKPLRFDDTDTISPFQFLKVHYESMSDWKWTADYLRCNPKFHDHPRYDFVLVQTTDKPIFAQLLYMFSCTVEGKSHHFALIPPLDAPTGNVKKKDKLLRFRRVRAQARKNSEFISLHSIIRGAVLVADSDRAGDFLVFDVLDGDTSLRLKSL